MSETTTTSAPKQKGRYAFEPAEHEAQLRAVLLEVARAPSTLPPPELQRLLRRFPRAGRGIFTKSELIRGARWLDETSGLAEIGIDLEIDQLILRLRRKPIRTLSGVAPVTVLTKPFPCPGRCIFCPSDVRMPKSYLSDEPGAQRAAEHQFDPYRQTLSRLLTLHNTGHHVDKVELIILGGTWSFYPEPYQIWFVKRCFDAMEDFASGLRELPGSWRPDLDFRQLDDQIDGGRSRRSYNQVVDGFVRLRGGPPQGTDESATWPELEQAHRDNEDSTVRCVGLVVETRPDRIDEQEVVRIRRLGATKVQIGYQSLDDRVLELNRRGHDVAATRRAMALLRRMGFKIHAHWMPNLYGSSPEADRHDYERMFVDPDFRPDELKIYPCSLIESAELMAFWRDGRWRPYEHQELLEVLGHTLTHTPRYCRLTRVIRDIPGTDIVVGNKLTNFRQIAQQDVEGRGEQLLDIRARELRGREVRADELELASTSYRCSVGEESFLEVRTAEDRLAGFLRLQLPDRQAEEHFVEELRGCAMVREVHVYGALVALGDRKAGRAQHAGQGARLVELAAAVAAERGYERLAVISAIGTRGYYRRLGFDDGELYQLRDLRQRPPTPAALEELTTVRHLEGAQ